ncbi:MAG: hypothetical protein LBG27_13860 [Spirochaetaceae bacterium]|jgi:recombinational DNA repair protein RecR|nr:hypothetical protein [Spirochaetaceae bacterium]
MYTPQFSDKGTISVRRLAWALEVSMPKAVDQIIDALPFIYTQGVICLACKDQTKCAMRAFCDQTAGGQSKPAA